jgi:hypothetical protein
VTGDFTADGVLDVVISSGQAVGGSAHSGLGRLYLFAGGSEGLDSTPLQIVESTTAFDGYGSPLVSIGDVNGDGAGELLVSSHDQLDLYFGAAEGLSLEPVHMLSLAGLILDSVVGPIDLDGDEFSDIIIVLFNEAEGRPQAEVRRGGGASGLSTVASPLLDPIPAGSGSTNSGLRDELLVPGAGDVTGDGYLDIVTLWTDPYLRNARAVVFPGDASGPGASAIPEVTLLIDADATGALSSSIVGDFNGDGYTDLVVTIAAYYYDNEMLYFFRGGSDGLDGTPAASMAYHMTESPCLSVEAVGDRNGDGFDDMLVTTCDGELCLLGDPDFGTTGEASLCEDAVTENDLNADGYEETLSYISASYPDGALIVQYGTSEGPGTGALQSIAPPDWTTGSLRLGSGAANLGDLDGDGIHELLLGAPGDNEQGGRVFLFSQLLVESNEIEQSTTLREGEAGDEFGAAVGQAGDINGDGQLEIIVGAPGTEDDRGAAWLFGLDGASALPEPMLELDGEAAGDRFGALVGGAGDVDGDGYDDVYIGAPGRELLQVFMGSPTGLGESAAASLAGTAPDDGPPAAGAPADFNRDGYTDLVFGIPGASDGAGAALGWKGGAGGYESWFRVDGEPGDELGYSLSADGDLNEDGRIDLGAGAPGAAGLGEARLYAMEEGGPEAEPWLVLQGDETGGRFGEGLTVGSQSLSHGFPGIVITAPGRVDGLIYVHRGYASGWINPEAEPLDMGDESPQQVVSLDISGDGCGDVIGVWINPDPSADWEQWKLRGWAASGQDEDGDGFVVCQDCDDDERKTYPGAAEVADDGIDQDCDGVDLEEVEEEPLDSGDPQDSAADTALDGDTAPPSSAGGGASHEGKGCGCASSSGGPRSSVASLLGLLALLFRGTCTRVRRAGASIAPS